jgi:hypothetical protein
MTILASKDHTEGDTRRWRIQYHKWLDNAAEISQVDVTSNSATCTVSNISILGKEVIFFLSDGILGETLTVTVVMTDSFGNIKTDTITFHVVAP